MDHYLEIRLLPDPEFPANLLLDALYAKLHRALVDEASGRIGISFPAHDAAQPTLGNRLRLHAKAERLDAFISADWLKGMRDHTEVSPVLPVPAGAQQRSVRRIQVKSSPERLRRRAMRRKGLSESEAKAAIPDSKAKRLALPFVTLDSRTTGQRFRLFIEHGPLDDQAREGEFSHYGLSPNATIPWF